VVSVISPLRGGEKSRDARHKKSDLVVARNAIAPCRSGHFPIRCRHEREITIPLP
jgi:hypothetical protein